MCVVKERPAKPSKINHALRAPLEACLESVVASPCSEAVWSTQTTQTLATQSSPDHPDLYVQITSHLCRIYAHLPDSSSFHSKKEVSTLDQYVLYHAVSLILWLPHGLVLDHERMLVLHNLTCSARKHSTEMHHVYISYHNKNVRINCMNLYDIICITLKVATTYVQYPLSYLPFGLGRLRLQESRMSLFDAFKILNVVPHKLGHAWSQFVTCQLWLCCENCISRNEGWVPQTV